jgi:hypothetical protein
VTGRASRRLALVVLDGWGVIEDDVRGDVLRTADTPFLDSLSGSERCLLRASARSAEFRPAVSREPGCTDRDCLRPRACHGPKWTNRANRSRRRGYHRTHGIAGGLGSHSGGQRLPVRPNGPGHRADCRCTTLTRHTRNRVPCWLSGPEQLERHAGTLCRHRSHLSRPPAGASAS